MDKSLLEKHLPFKSHFVTIAGQQMHYLDEGNEEGKEVVLCLHGNPTWSFFYRNLISELKSDYRVVAPDLLGMGLSDHPIDAHYRASDRILHIQEFIETLKLDKFTLVMHDWGGSIGTGVAVRNIEKINRLIYFNTTLTVTESLPKLIKTAASPLFGIGKFLTKTTKRFLHFTTELGVAKKLPKEIKKCYYLPYKSKARRQAIWDFVADIPFENSHPSYSDMLDLAKRISNLKDIPVQIIWGLKDPCFHRDMLNNVAVLFPQARVLEIPEASHLVLEDATETCISTIKSFMSLPYADAIQPLFAPNTLGEKIEEANTFYKNFIKIADTIPYSFASIVPSFLINDVKYAQVNYKDLRLLINQYQRGLHKLGLTKDDKVLMLVTPGINFLALSYAVMARGAIPVFLDPGMGRERLVECIKDLKPDVFIGSPLAQVLKYVKGKLFSDVKFQVVATEWFIGKGYSLSYFKKFSTQPLDPVACSDIALIAYTSGGTGTPKGVVFTNTMIQEQLEIFKNTFGLEAGKKDLPLLPIFSLYNLALGVTSVFAPINPAKPLDLDPQKIVQIINDLGINYSFGSPTLWKKIGEYCFRSKKPIVSLSKIFMAGAAVPKETIELLNYVLPNGKCYTPYGATECLPVTLISGDDILNTILEPAITGEQGTLVGKAISNVELRVVKKIDGEVLSLDNIQELAPYEIGEVIVKGKNISREYWNNPEANQKSKISDQNDFWHCIGDMGYLDNNKNLYFCGRKVDVVEYKDRVFHSVPVETIFNKLEKVSRSALVRLASGEPAIIIEPLPQFFPQTSKNKQEFVHELKKLALNFKITNGITKFFFNQKFPVDGRHNAKIFRGELGTWASKEVEELKAV